MRFSEHVADLRRRIIWILVVFFGLLCLSLGLVARLYRYLTAPITRLGYHLMVVSPGEIVMVYLAVAGVVAAGLTMPFALYQLWRFVRPGLTPLERRYAQRLLPVMLAMFVLGVAFAWFVVFPMVLRFLLQLASRAADVHIRVNAYFSFLTGLCLPFGLVFELPVVVAFLTRIGVITPRVLRRWRRYAYLVIVVVGVFISPPEMITHLSVILPMIALYECSILISAWVERRAARLRTEASGKAGLGAHAGGGSAAG